MAIELESSSVLCCKCGKAYCRRKGFFSVCYSEMSKGIGYLPVCKDCVDMLYNSYLAKCQNAKDAVRQVCRKLDLYWNESVFDIVSRKSTISTMMTSYLAKITTVTYAGKSYDDTLSFEGTLWNFSPKENDIGTGAKDNIVSGEKTDERHQEDLSSIPEDVIAFWGPGYTSEMYNDLEQRRSYWISKLPSGVDLDIGAEALIRQICNLEIDINRDRRAGKSIDKNVNALNTLLGSASLKPTQKKAEDSDLSSENTPFGVWIKKWEDMEPVPEPDPELQDVDGIRKYISVWFFGHLCKMLKIRNSYSRAYEEEIAKMRVERPEYSDEDDEEMLADIFGDSSSAEDE